MPSPVSDSYPVTVVKVDCCWYRVGRSDQSLWLNPDTEKFSVLTFHLPLQVTQEGLSHLYLPVTLKCDTGVW